MKIEFIAKNYEAKEKLKELYTKKIARLDKFFHDDIKIKVMLKKSGENFTTELTILLDGIILRTEVSGDNMFENIDIALPKLEKQIIKHRAKITDKSKKVSIKELEQSFIPELHGASSNKNGVVRSKTYQLTPMQTEDAISELELVGHSFFVFLNKLTNAVNIVYKRFDGGYGLIETVV
ncbi:MAG: ribosome-associated translation inhibitor RaiA [Firmicutes bacterium]|nr:ribosome-associated translation inhibitor RaiA [Bacillota bacterium]